MTEHETKDIAYSPEEKTSLSEKANRLGQLIYDNYVLNLFTTQLDPNLSIKEITKQHGLLGYMEDVKLGWRNRRRQTTDAVWKIASTKKIDTNRPENLSPALALILVDGVLEGMLELAEVDEKQISQITEKYVLPDRINRFKKGKIAINQTLCNISIAEQLENGDFSLTREGKIIAQSFITQNSSK